MSDTPTDPVAGPPPTAQLVNLPNALTTLRLIVVPLCAVLLLAEDGSGAQRIWATLFFVAAIITDRYDGLIARRRNQVTDFGKLADPIADKALTGMAFIGLAIIFDSWLFWTVTVLVLVREWGITAMRFAVKKYGVMPASKGGKLKTMLQAIALGGYVLPLELWDNVAADALRWATHVVMAAAVAQTLWTGAVYVRDAIALRREAQDRSAA